MLKLPANKYNQAHLVVPTSNRLLTLMGELEGPRRLLKGGGLSCNPTGHNIDKIKAAYPGIQIVQPVESPPPSTSVGIIEYKSKLPDRVHQALAKKHVRGKRGAGLFMDTGTGKTKVTLDLAGELFCAGKITGLLVFAPLGVHRQWVEAQIPIHLGVPSVSAYWPFEEIPDQLLADYRKLKVLTINWDSLRRPEGLRLVNQFVFGHKGKLLCVADEAHRIKNKNGKTWNAADAVAHRCAYRLALTATPVAKDLTDEWAILNWADEDILGIRYVSSFRNEFCVMGGYLGKSVIAHKNIERFREKVDPYVYRVTKREIGMQPPVYTPWLFDMTLGQKDMCRDMRAELMAELESGEVTTASNPAVKFLRMQQISNGFIMTEEGEVRPIFKNPLQNPRIAALLALLDSVEGKVIIWARFQADIDLIASALPEGSYVKYYGATGEAERKQSLESFKSPGGARYFISNPAAGGTGLDGLQTVCSTDVYYSNSDNFVDRVQSEGRIDRIGGLGVANHYDLLTRGAIDFAIKARHRKKTQISEMAIGDLKQIFDDEDYFSQNIEQIVSAVDEDEFNRLAETL